MKEEAQRIKKLPPYLFARIEKKVAECKAKGLDVISLGIGDPDQPTPKHIIDSMAEQIYNGANHQYPSSAGMLSYRTAVADWYKNRFNVDLDPVTEVVSVIGSKEGIANISFCYLDPGDISLVPDPGYPVYGIGALLAGGEAYYVPAGAATNYLLDLESIPEDIARKAKLLWINYPNNPTGAIADRAFYEKVVAFAKKYGVIVCHDAAYSEMSYDGYVPLSFMEIPGAKDVGIEFNSLSKPFNMTGWRIGWAVGNAKVIETLGRYKSNVDSGAFQAIQYAAITGLASSQDCVGDMAKIYQERRDILVDGLREIGWDVPKPKATFYVWAPVPKGYGTSEEFAEFLLDKAQVVVTPGNGYGKNGEGFIRMAITIDKVRIAEAVERMKKALGKIEF